MLISLIFLILAIISATANRFILGFGIGSRLDEQTFAQRPRSAWNNPTFFLDESRWASVQLAHDPTLRSWLLAFRATGWMALIFFLALIASTFLL